ncbi:hypothetical protein [Methanotorris formicicus]|uniref:Uncharacterized protein n=1 Tax=Methanotorris formicicus Mc-S-70 TaxID=647171 RepID=H1KZI0_9EURY|nr:hypothetical protein [Methanotorris formicicus]EHP85988.1 hypothetical protein MetfoDRAFT_1203 [Methanotorris formicicus Mc-S-70]
MIIIKKDILKIEELVEGVAMVKLGLDTRNHAKGWLLEVVNWFAGNRCDLRDDEIKLGNRLRDWMGVGVSLIIPKELKLRFDEFYKMAERFGWELAIRDDVMFKTTLNDNEVYVLMLRGDVVGERLDNVLNGGGVFDLGERVVCDDEWFSGWLVRDIDVNKRYVESVGEVEFQEPGNSGYFSGECLNKRKYYKWKHYSGVDLLKMIDSMLNDDSNVKSVFKDMDYIKNDFNKVFWLIDNLYGYIKELKCANYEDFSKINKILDNLEEKIYEIEDYIITIKNSHCKSVFDNIIGLLSNIEEISDEELLTLKDICELSSKVCNAVKMIEELLKVISEIIRRSNKFESNKGVPNEIIRRLNILNTFIDKICRDIVSMRENECKVLHFALSNLYRACLSKNEEEKEVLVSEIRNMVDALYFDCYSFLEESIGKYEFKFIKDLASMSLMFDYAEELKKEGRDDLFNHIIFKILKYDGFDVKEYNIIDTLLNIRKNLSLLCEENVRYFDKKLMGIIREFFECSGRDEFYSNMDRLKEFVENLEDISQILEKYSMLWTIDDDDNVFYDLDDICYYVIK